MIPIPAGPVKTPDGSHVAFFPQAWIWVNQEINFALYNRSQGVSGGYRGGEDQLRSIPLRHHLDLAARAYAQRDPFTAEAIFRRSVGLAADLLEAVAIAERVAATWDRQDRYFAPAGAWLMELAMQRALDLCRNSEDARWVHERCKHLRVHRAAEAASWRALELPRDGALQELRERAAALV